MVAGRDNDILLGNGGADVLIGGHGNDLLSIGDTTFRRVNGGTGHDVLAFSAPSPLPTPTSVKSRRLKASASAMARSA